MNPTPAADRPEWLEWIDEGLFLTWPVRLIIIGIGAGLWTWGTAWSVRHCLRTLRWRLAVKGEET